MKVGSSGDLDLSREYYKKLFLVFKDVFKRQYISCIKVGSGGNLGLSREYPKKLLGPILYSRCNCPLMIVWTINIFSSVIAYNE